MRSLSVRLRPGRPAAGLACVAALVGAVGLMTVGRDAAAQHGTGGFFGRAVGGVAVNPEGVLGKVVPADRDEMRKILATEVDGAEKAAIAPVKMRMISLKAVEAALAGAGEYEKLPDEIKYLGGLQRLQYVFVEPESGDVILAGPAEGWRVGETGDVVGLTTGQPVVMLADLVTALRTVEAARTEGLTCSIDPTMEGRDRLEALFRKVSTFSDALVPEVQAALGPQQITLTGLPGDSHMARVLVAADYRLKSISMGLEPSPVKGIPNFLELVSHSARVPANMMPRWWMACDYRPLAKSEDGLSWEIKGPGVKVMTEEELIEDGKIAGTGKGSKIAESLAEAFNANMETLSARQPIFGQLRNVMDACVVAALIAKHGLFEKAGLATPTLLGQSGKATFRAYPTPKTVGTEVSFVTITGGRTVITASGGVDVDSWAVVDRAPTAADMASVRAQALDGAAGLWWNPVTR